MATNPVRPIMKTKQGTNCYWRAIHSLTKRWNSIESNREKKKRNESRHEWTSPRLISFYRLFTRVQPRVRGIGTERIDNVTQFRFIIKIRFSVHFTSRRTVRVGLCVRLGGGGGRKNRKVTTRFKVATPPNRREGGPRNEKSTPNFGKKIEIETSKKIIKMKKKKKKKPPKGVRLTQIATAISRQPIRSRRLDSPAGPVMTSQRTNQRAPPSRNDVTAD